MQGLSARPPCHTGGIRGEHRLDGIPELPDGAESKVGSVRWPLGRGSILPIGCRWLNPSFRWGLLSVGLLSVSSRPHIQVGDHLFQCHQSAGHGGFVGFVSFLGAIDFLPLILVHTFSDDQFKHPRVRLRNMNGEEA